MTTTLISTTVRNGNDIKFVVSLSYDKHGFYIIDVYEVTGSAIVDSLKHVQIFDRDKAISKHSKLVKEYFLYY